MPELMLYLVKANIALCLFYLAYRLGLRRLTFYTLNRFFLLSGIVFSSLFPLVDVNDFFNRNEALAQQVITYVPDLNAWQAAAPQNVFTVWTLLEWTFWAGVAVMFLRLMVQLASLALLHRKTAPGTLLHRNVRLMGKTLNPFSFFRNIYVNPALHADHELEAILDHEAVHVKEWHSADVLLGEVNNMFYWFNPGAWLMKTAIRENLEFLTDRAILRSGMDPKAYQYSLIQVNTSQYASGIANNFSFSHLKNRIMMMNKRRSSRLHIYRYAVLACLVSGALLSLNFTKPGTVANDVVTEVKSVLAGQGAAIREAFTGEKTDTVPGAVKEKRLVKVVKDSGVVLITREVKGRNGLKDTISFSAHNVRGQKDAATIIAIQADTVTARTVMLREVAKGWEGPIGGPEGGSGAKEMVKGRISGVQVRDRERQAAPNVVLRFNSQDSSSRAKPLIVLDGEIYEEELTSVDVNNIEAVSVLKGTSASALYGPKGNNGVILITTKRPASQAATVAGRTIASAGDKEPEEVRVTGRRAARVSVMAGTVNTGWNAAKGTGNSGVKEVVVTGRPHRYETYRLGTATVRADSVRTVSVTGYPAPLAGSVKGSNAVTLETIYPNPTSGAVNFTLHLPKAGNGYYEIVDLEGKRVYYKSLQGISGVYKGNVDLSSRPAGTYVLNVVLPGQGRLSSKIVKQ